VGLTSPPELFVNLVVPQNPQFFHTHPVLSSEDHTLQIAVAKLSSGNSSIRKTSNSPGTDYAIRNLRNVFEIPVCSKYCKNNPSFYLTPTNLFFHPNSLAFGAISNLDLLSVHKKIIKIRSNGTASFFTST